MKARWVFQNPSPGPDAIGQAIVASWWPGRFHLISTVSFNHLIGRRPKSFVTQIFRCDSDGVVHGLDFSKELYSKEHATREEAEIGHKMIVDLFVAGRLRT